MKGREPNPDDTPPPLPRAYAALLSEAEDMAAKALDRIHELNERYPAAVPDPQLEQLERAFADPGSERRGALRLLGGPERVQICLGMPPGRPTDALVIDRSPGGVSLRHGSLFLPGTVLGVRLPDRETWFPVQVRHSRPDGNGWVVGCEFLGDRPVI